MTVVRKRYARLPFRAVNDPCSPARKIRALRTVRRDLRRVKTVLAEIVVNEEINRWLSAENVVLGGITPLEAIKQGETKRVLAILRQIADGIYV